MLLLLALWLFLSCCFCCCRHKATVPAAAAIGEIVPIDLKSESAIIEEYNLNIITPTLLCKKFIQSYKEKHKLIINVSSGAANKSIVSWNIYCATKSALDRLTNVIAKEDHKNLHVFSVHPGIVDTNMQAEIRNSDPNLFPLHQNFVDYYTQNCLISVKSTALGLHHIIVKKNNLEEIILDLRNFQ